MSSPELFNGVESLEPLLPATMRHELAEWVLKITGASHGLQQQLPSPLNRRKIANLVSGMNSYYSNLIEGNKTYPRDIEEALRQDAPEDSNKHENQHFATAHVCVERAMRRKLADEPDLEIHNMDFVRWLHREFYRHVPPHLHFGKKQNGELYPIEMGEFRTFEVVVGSHQAPHFGAVKPMMKRLQEFYGSKRILATTRLIVSAAAHHRLAWIHPFGDGNGRVARLQTEADMIRLGVDADGLWTISRGFARNRDAYYEHLRRADEGRIHDADGRGNLSDQRLGEFCIYFLSTMADQIEFMSELLDFSRLAGRMESHLHVHHSEWSLKNREQIARMLKAALLDGEIDRATAARVAGVSESTARGLIQKALEAGVLCTPSPKGRLSLQFGSEVWDTYFPKLYQDLPL